MEYEIISNTLIPHYFKIKDKVKLARKLESEYSVYSNGLKGKDAIICYVHDNDVLSLNPEIQENEEIENDKQN